MPYSKIVLLFFLFVFQYNLIPAQNPAPAPSQKNGVVITGATAHIGSGEVIQNSIIIFENGKISLVGNADEIAAPKAANFEFIDATGKHVYPGLIALNSRLGLVEIDMVRATQDFAEVGDFNPNVRSIIAYNTDAEVIPTVRSNGVLMAQVCPSGGLISGQSSLVQLDAWNWEDAILQADGAVHLFWPNPVNFSFRQGRTSKNENYEKQGRSIEQFFEESKAYTYKNAPDISNLKMEAMRGIFDGSKKLFVHASAALPIQESVLLAEKFNIKPVVVGGKDSWMLTDFLKKHDVAVVLSETQSLPSREDEDIDQPFKTPAILQNAGILFAITAEGSWQQFNLAFQAGQAVGFGLEKETALQAVTLNPAKILDMEKQIGSLEIGKDATLFISDGDALDMRGNNVTQAWIQGRKISLDNKHKRLYQKFKTKYEQQR